MTIGNESPALVAALAERETFGEPAHCNEEPKTLRANSKRASMLRAFLQVGASGLNCFQSANEHHDYVLRSTVSDFRRDFGITFEKRPEVVPGFAGSRVHCVRYALTQDGAAKARKLLAEAA